VIGVFTAELAKLFEFELIRRLLLILGGGIIATLALGAVQTNDNAHTDYFFLCVKKFPNKGSHRSDSPSPKT
jgi:hypothetical protein